MVLDNLNSHERNSLAERYGQKLGGLLWDRFTVHYTLWPGNRVNQAETQISLPSRQCPGRRRIVHAVAMQREVRASNRCLSRDASIAWNFTRKHARQKRHYAIGW